MPTTPNWANSRSAPVANMVVWEDASARKFGWLSTLELSASAKMNAAVAVRNSSPTKTAVFLVDGVRVPRCCIVEASILGVVTVDIWSLLVVDSDRNGTSVGRKRLRDGCIAHPANN